MTKHALFHFRCLHESLPSYVTFQAKEKIREACQFDVSLERKLYENNIKYTSKVVLKKNKYTYKSSLHPLLIKTSCNLCKIQ